MTKKIKENQLVFCLYVNLTSNYVSFKIEEGKFLGELTKTKLGKKAKIGKGYYVIEHKDDEVNYLKMDDIHETDKDAYKALKKILADKIKTI